MPKPKVQRPPAKPPRREKRNNKGQFLKGHPRAPGSGRKPGQINRITREIRQMVFEAVEGLGGVEYLMKQGKKRNAAPFLALVGKCLPKEVKITDDRISITLLGVARGRVIDGDARVVHQLPAAGSGSESISRIE